MEEIKSLDITQKYPQVLLMGNGLTRNTGYTWHDFIKSCAKENAEIEKYKKGDTFQVPNTILSLAVMESDDELRHKKYISKLKKIKYTPNLYIDRLIKIPFDSILTTNYTYEIEYAMKNSYPGLSDNAKAYYSKSSENDAKYLIHTYNRFENFPPVWHIHGETRRKSSLILSHEEYARETNKIVEYCNSRKNYYEKYSQDIHVKSWIDYFILGDIYILGLGFDFSEFDLWWLINRRVREKSPKGNIYFYEPENDDNKYKLAAMNDIGIKVESFGICIEKNDGDINAKYSDFYSKAIDDIAQKTGEKQNGSNKM